MEKKECAYERELFWLNETNVKMTTQSLFIEKMEFEIFSHAFALEKNAQNSQDVLEITWVISKKWVEWNALGMK